LVGRWDRRRRFGFGQAGNLAWQHKVGADEPGERQQARNAGLALMGDTQQQERDHGDGKLDAHGVFGCAEEPLNLERLLHPAKEQLDIPAGFVEASDHLCRSSVSGSADVKARK
jgi:hypothetical protein